MHYGKRWTPSTAARAPGINQTHFSRAISEKQIGKQKGPWFPRLLRNSVDRSEINEKMPSQSEGIFYELCAGRRPDPRNTISSLPRRANPERSYVPSDRC